MEMRQKPVNNDLRAEIYLHAIIIAWYRNLGFYIVHLCNLEPTI
jgi:hypothetical protein